MLPQQLLPQLGVAGAEAEHGLRHGYGLQHDFVCASLVHLHMEHVSSKMMSRLLLTKESGQRDHDCELLTGNSLAHELSDGGNKHLAAQGCHLQTLIDTNNPDCRPVTYLFQQIPEFELFERCVLRWKTRFCEGSYGEVGGDVSSNLLRGK